MLQEWINALLGGLVIGVAVSLMLLFNGRVTGISGIIYGTMGNPQAKEDKTWRIYFIAGLIVGGIFLRIFFPHTFQENISTSHFTLIIAGLLVGFGTILGSGCTSGHGVCGLSRLSVRSLIATMTFILSGVLTVYLVKLLGVNL